MHPLLDATTLPVLVVHGGAWTKPGAAPGPYEEGCKAALVAGFGVLSAGGSAMDAVVEAVRVMEEDPIFNAGVGSSLTSVGTVEMDASVMDHDLSAGAVAGVTGVRNPVVLAREVMRSSGHVFLGGRGAEAFAAERGIELVSPEFHITEAQRARHLELKAEREGAGGIATNKLGTVGAVAVDVNGRVAAATSTGGTQFKRPGRIGDSPVIGSGTYADGLSGAVSATGHGESILKLVLAKSVVDALETGKSPRIACGEFVSRARSRINGDAGLIAVDRTGRAGWAFNTPSMSRGFFRAGMDAPVVAVGPDAG